MHAPHCTSDSDGVALAKEQRPIEFPQCGRCIVLITVEGRDDCSWSSGRSRKSVFAISYKRMLSPRRSHIHEEGE